MTHLKEEEFIDVLLGEPHDVGLKQHLEQCEACATQMETLRLGLEATREVEPTVPLMAVPRISHRRFKRRQMVTRISWIAAAAMLLFSLLGFRLEINNEGFAIQFALPGSGAQVSEQKVAELEERLKVMELNAAIAQSDLDARFNMLFEETGEERRAFSEALDMKMTDLRIENANYLSSIRADLQDGFRKPDTRGKLQ